MAAGGVPELQHAPSKSPYGPRFKDPPPYLNMPPEGRYGWGSLEKLGDLGAAWKFAKPKDVPVQKELDDGESYTAKPTPLVSSANWQRINPRHRRKV